MSAAAYKPVLGYMPMPLNFKYQSVFLRGKPRHQKYDDFWRKHPPMSAARWAKIFSPFDALDGFDEAVSAKNELYVPRRELSEYQKEDLDRKLASLRLLAYNSKLAGLNQPSASITYFSPCADVHNEWYGTGGQYEEISGIVTRVDPISRSIVVNDHTIPLDDIIAVDIGGD